MTQDPKPRFERRKSRTHGQDRRIARRPSDVGPVVSYAQRRLWVIDRIAGKSAAYNSHVVVRLRGRVDSGSLRRAAEYLAQRHEVLRTVFRERDGAPEGVLLNANAVGYVEHVGVSEAEASRIVRENVTQPIDLAEGPLFQVVHARFGQDESLLLLLLHHIVVDAASVGILWKEFWACYETGGRDPGLPALPIQYSDFAWWQRSWLRGEVVQRQLEYWHQQLAGLSADIELPFDRARPPVPSHHGASVRFSLPRHVADRLSELAQGQQVTMFMVLLAGFQALLARYSGRSDIAVGSPVLGRGRAELEPLIGFFVNTVVMRTDLSGDPTFTELIQRVRQTTLGAYGHQDLPLERLLEELQTERDPSRNPLFQVMFSVDHLMATGVTAPSGIGTEFVEISNDTAKFDLSLSVHVGAEEVLGTVVYSTDLFHEATVERLARHYVRLIEAMVANPASRLSQAEILTPAERTVTLIDGGPVRAADTTIPQLVESQVTRTPDRVAVVCGQRRLTYAELDRAANRLAHRLLAAGIEPEGLVAIFVDRTEDVVVAMLAVLKAGGAFLALDRAYPRDRISSMIEDSGTRFVVTREAHVGDVPALGLTTVLLDDEAGPAHAPTPRCRPDSLAYVTYTSGSTGRPKGVMSTHRGVANYLFYVSDVVGLKADDVVMNVASVSFDASTREIFGPLTVGGRVVLVPVRTTDVPALVTAAAEHDVTALLSLVPSLLSALSTVSKHHPDAPLTSLRLGMVAGEPLTAGHVEQAKDVAESWQIVNQYGPTECTMTSTFAKVDDGDVSIGRPIPGMRCYVLDRYLKPVAPGTIGEVYIAGPGVSRGYLGRPAATAERFVPDPFGQPGSRMFRTGDLAKARADGVLEFTGRADGQVKIRGVRVEPAEVEAALRRHPAVRDVAVVARGDHEDGLRLGAYFVAEQPVTPVALRDYLAQSLPDPMVPSSFVALEALPLSPNGKVDRKNLPVDDPVTTTERPRTATELRMSRVWSGVLRSGSVGVQDNFFVRGGHSLRAVELAGAVHREFGVEVPVNTVYLRPTIEQLSAWLDESPGEPDELVTLRGGDAHLFLIHPISGDITGFFHLAGLLPQRYALHAIEPVGYSSDRQPLDSITAMARHYVQRIRQAAPFGPYRLAGWSLGGNVAFEMARLLEDDGQDVAFLGMIDARAFGHGPEDDSSGGLSDDQILSFLLKAGGHDDIPAGDAVRRMVAVFRANAAAVPAYEPTGRVRADITLFKATTVDTVLGGPEVDPAGWHDRTKGDVHVIPVSGTHYDLLRPPHVQAVAEALGDQLGSVD